MKAQLDPKFSLEPPELEAAAQRMRRNRACPEGKECLACAREVQEARTGVAAVFALGFREGREEGLADGQTQLERAAEASALECPP